MTPASVSQCVLPKTAEIPITDVFKNTKHLYRAEK